MGGSSTGIKQGLTELPRGATRVCPCVVRARNTPVADGLHFVDVVLVHQAIKQRKQVVEETASVEGQRQFCYSSVSPRGAAVEYHLTVQRERLAPLTEPNAAVLTVNSWLHCPLLALGP